MSPRIPGIGPGDGQLDEVRQLHGDRAAVDEQHVDLDVLLEEVARVADLVGGERDLLVGLEVHEVVAVVAVQVLHALVLEIDQLHLLAGPEGRVDDVAEPEVLQLGAHEGAALAGLHVLEIHDAVRLAVVERSCSPFLNSAVETCMCVPTLSGPALGVRGRRA